MLTTHLRCRRQLVEKQVLFIVALLIAVATATSLSIAQVPKIISHQGYLANVGGQGVNGTLPMTFRLFTDSTGGAAAWTQTFSSVQVSKGVYNVNLDVSTVATFSAQYWFETEVNGEVQSPRARLTSAPYALQALNARQADTADYARVAPGIAFVDSARIAGTVTDNAVTTSKIADSSITTAKLANNAVTSGKIATGQVVKSLNGHNDGVTLSAAGGATVTSSNDTIYINAGAGGAGTGIQGVQNTNSTLDIINPNGPTATINIKNLGITATQLANDAVTSAKVLDGTIQRADVQAGFKAPYADTSDHARNNWSINGNAGTTAGTNFVGTTDAQALDIRTNNVLRTRITTKGQIEMYNTGQSVFVGEGAGANDDLTTNQNVFVGYRAGFSNTTGSNNTANGGYALSSNTTGQGNTANGWQALYSNVTGHYATALGTNAMYYANNTATAFINYNVAVGYEALRGSTTASANTGNYNTALGHQTLYSNTTGSSNTANGMHALMNNTTGYYNIANGSIALYFNTTGYQNTANGVAALYSNTTGFNNTALGLQAGNNNSTGSGNVFLGYRAGYTETGSNKLYIANSNANPPLIYGDFSTGNVGIGTTSPAAKLDVVGTFKIADGTQGAGKLLTSDASGLATWAAAGSSSWNLTGNAGTTAGTNFVGTTDAQAFDIRTNNILRTRFTTKGQIETYNTGRSVFVGEGAGANDDLTTNQNVFVGYQAGFSNTSGIQNTANGYQALYSNTTGAFNTANGLNALYSNTTGNNNTANGVVALYLNTSGIQNTANGMWALYSNTTGSFNTANGLNALYSNTIGNNNTANGLQALTFNTSGIQNTANGYAALLSNTTGNNNTANGSSALSSNTTGFTNTALGYSAGSTVTTGSNLTLIGYSAQPTSVSATNQITLGNASVTSLRCAVTTITALSDARDKKNIQELSLGLDFISKLKPRQFNWDKREWYESKISDGSKMQEAPTAGFIAQELDEVQTTANAEWLNLVLKDNPEKIEATPGNLFPIMVKAIQELKTENEDLKKRLSGIEAMVKSLSEQKQNREHKSIGLSAESRQSREQAGELK